MPAVPTTLGSLPDEVLAIVFRFCDQCTRMMTIPAVSRRWLHVCQQHTRVASLGAERSLNHCAITDAGLTGLVSRFPYLERIVLDRCTNVTDGGLAAVAAGCPNLQCLDLRRCVKVTDSGLEGVANRCPPVPALVPL